MTSNKVLVQQHRAKMKASGFLRIEVTIGSGMIDRARQIGRQTGWPLWRVVEDAIQTYVIPEDAAGNGK